MTEISAGTGKNWRKRGYGSWYHQKSRRIYPAGAIYSYAEGKQEVPRGAGKEGFPPSHGLEAGDGGDAIQMNAIAAVPLGGVQGMICF